MEQQTTKRPPRTWLKWILGLIVLIAIVQIATKKNTDSTGSTTPSKATLDSALVAVKAEKKVADAVITDASVLYAWVKDDGTRRDGYAEYLCQLLNERKTGIERVKIVEVGTQGQPGADNAYGRLLGNCWCKDYSH